VYLQQMKDLLRRHPGTTIIWAHMGLGRVVHPVQSSGSAPATERAPGQMAAIVGDIVKDPSLRHVYFDISWDEVAKYVIADPQITARAAAFLNDYPDRFLFGTDEVAPKDQQQYLKVYVMYEPLWKQLTPDAREKVRKLNYERLFDAARLKVRAWERSHVAAQPEK
jgi:predicted TIM-barrel fold metal-dependent hydrolase